jgi:ketosteroid isomerase-like protein
MKEKIEKNIANFNKAWTQGKIEDILPLLHKDAIFLAPDLKTEISGRDACLQTIKDYVNNAKTNAFNVANNTIHFWQHTAVVSIEYFIEYEMNNKIYKESGKEFWTMINESGEWQIVWRSMLGNESVK